MSIKISEYTTEQTTIADDDKQELSTETAPGVWETRWYSYLTLKNQIANDINYQSITLSDFNTLVGASGLVVGKWYLVTSAVTHPVYGSMDLLVQAISTSTFDEKRVYGIDNLGVLLPTYVTGSTDSSFSAYVITGGWLPLTDAQILAYSGGFNSNVPVIIGNGLAVVSHVSDDGTNIVLNNCQSNTNGDFGTYDPTTSTFTPNAVASGDVVGPSSSTNNNVAFFDGITGKLLKDSGLTLSGSNTGDETTATIKTKLGAAATGADGYLTSTDWNTFNGKQSSLGFTPANVTANLSDLANSTTARANLKILQAENAAIITNNTVTATAITGMSFSAVANKTYYIYGAMRFGSGGAGGTRFSVTIPSGATIGFELIGTGSSQTNTSNANIDAGASLSLAFCTVNSSAGVIHFKGTIEISSTAGTVQLNFAAGTAGQTSTINKLGSYLIAIEK